MCPANARHRAVQLAPEAARLREAAKAMVADRLADLLVESPRSLAQLSEEAGLGESTVGRIARGVVEPTLSEMVALAAVFGLASIEELVAPLGTTMLIERTRGLSSGDLSGPTASLG
jgi:transcriptional regulator with XRE-family HTH domain